MAHGDSSSILRRPRRHTRLRPHRGRGQGRGQALRAGGQPRHADRERATSPRPSAAPDGGKWLRWDSAGEALENTDAPSADELPARSALQDVADFALGDVVNVAACDPSQLVVTITVPAAPAEEEST